jgi:hypothetical protein
VRRKRAAALRNCRSAFKNAPQSRILRILRVQKRRTADGVTRGCILSQVAQGAGTSEMDIGVVRGKVGRQIEIRESLQHLRAVLLYPPCLPQNAGGSHRRQAEKGKQHIGPGRSFLFFQSHCIRHARLTSAQMQKTTGVVKFGLGCEGVFSIGQVIPVTSGIIVHKAVVVVTEYFTRIR